METTQHLPETQDFEILIAFSAWTLLNLPSNLKSTTNINSFKHKIKDKFFNDLQRLDDSPYVYYWQRKINLQLKVLVNTFFSFFLTQDSLFRNKFSFW